MPFLIASQREIMPIVSYANAYEFEDIICEVGNAQRVDLIAKPGLLQRLNGRSSGPTSVPCDLFFAHVMSPAEMRMLEGQGAWRDHPKKAIWIEEFWPPMLQYKKFVNYLKNFDHIFTINQDTPKLIEEAAGRPCSVLIPGVDALGFCPWPNAPERGIDVFSMGRRRQDLHRMLFERAVSDNRFHYMFDTTGVTSFIDGHAPHRMKLASMIKRTRFFIADKAKLNLPDQTGGSEVFGPRFFEGAAAGAILAGVPPGSDLFSSYFHWPDAYLPLPEGADPFPILDSFAADKDRVDEARKANVLNMLEHHDWVYRWEMVLEKMDMPAPRGVSERKAKLNARAEMIRAM